VKRLAPALAFLLVLAGCSSAGASGPAGGLKATCDSLGPVMKEFGQLTPNAGRYAEFGTKVKAIADAGDAETKTALVDLLAAFDKGVARDVAATQEMAAASIVLMGKCAATGSTAYAPAVPASSTAPAPAATPTESASDEPLDDQDLGELLGPEDFKVSLKILTKQCFGSAGCNVTFRIKPAFVGALDMPSSGTTEVTYKVKGGDDPLVNTFTIDEDGTAHFDSEESISTPRSSAKLKAVVTDVEWSE
jgi:hypothetical protein